MERFLFAVGATALLLKVRSKKPKRSITFKVKLITEWTDHNIQSAINAINSLPGIINIESVPGIGFLVKTDIHFDTKPLMPSLKSVGLKAKFVASFSTKEITLEAPKLRHACFRKAVPEKVLEEAFPGVLKHYHEQKLPEYSRYKNWTQSCYMQCDPKWIPRTEVNPLLFKSMEKILEITTKTFGEWYKTRHHLEEVQIVTLNSFITKYIPSEGKDEFGKHIDSANIDGSAICALPTDMEHDWPGLIVWDGTKAEDGSRPQKTYKLKPGDICCLDKLVWHRGLPITTGARYVAVLFYECKWKKLRGI